MMRKILQLYILTLLLITSCSKDNNTYSIVTDIKIPESSENVPIKSGSSITITGNGFFESCEIWLLPANLKAEITIRSNTSIVITVPYIDGEQSIILHQHDQEQTLGKIYTVKKNSELYSSWGLLSPIGEMRSNNRNYEWYINQNETGEFSLVNCGPSATTMTLKWNSVDFNKTTEEARATYHPNGGWWWTDDIINYLIQNNITPKTYAFNSVEDLKTVINADGIAILCIDSHYITETDNLEHRINKYYKSPEGSGHFIVVKGYIYANEKLFFEVYDPWSVKYKYDDGQYKGKDRYYSELDIYESADIWWKSIIAIFPQSRTKSADISSLEISNLPPQWGR